MFRALLVGHDQAVVVALNGECRAVCPDRRGVPFPSQATSPQPPRDVTRVGRDGPAHQRAGVAADPSEARRRRLEGGRGGRRRRGCRRLGVLQPVPVPTPPPDLLLVHVHQDQGQAAGHDGGCTKVVPRLGVACPQIDVT